MIKNKLITAVLAAEAEEEEKQTKKNVSPAVLAKTVKNTIKAATEAKASSPVSTYTSNVSKILETAKQAAIQKAASGTKTTTLPAATYSPGSLYGKVVQDYLKQGMAFAAQGPQSRQQIANSLLGYDIGNYNRGDISNLDMDALREMQLRNQYYITQHQNAGTFDSSDFLTDTYISLPSSSFLTNEENRLLNELNASKQKDEEAKAANSYRVNTWQQWSDMKNRLGEMTEDNAPWFYAYADYLTNGDLSKTFDMDAYDAAWNEMDDEAYWADMAAKQEMFEGLDWATLTDKSAERTAYESETPGIQAQYDLVSGEATRRKRLEEMQTQIRNQPDYESNSQYQGTEAIQYEPKYNDMGSMVDAYVKNKYVGKYSDQQFFMNNYEDYSTMMAAGDRDANVRKYIDEGYHLLTAQELADYNAYYKNDPEAAEEYLSLLRPALLARKASIDQEAVGTIATNPWLAAPMYAASIGAGLLSPVEAVRQAYDALTGNSDPNSASSAASRFKQNVQGAQEDWIGEAGGVSLFGKTLWQHLYSGATSAIENAARIGAYGPTGSLWAAGAQAASGSLQENAAREDMSGAAKIVQALLTGGVEIGTEKIGLDALFDKGKKNAFNYIKGVIGSELGEETLNYLSDDAIDAAVAFLFDHEADIKSAPEFWQGLGETALNTLISSALMGGGGAITQSIDNRATGKAIQEQGDPEKVLNIAKSMPKDSKSYAAAIDIEGSIVKGKKLSLGKLGKLTKALGAELSQEYADITNSVMEDAITERLVELGTDRSAARKNAAAIRKITQGEKLSIFDRTAVVWDDNADRVTKEISREMSQSTSQAEGAATAAPEGQRTGQKWVTDMKTHQMEAAEVYTDLGRQYRTALEKPVTKAAKSAAKAGAAKVNRRTNGKPTGEPTAKKVYFDDGTSKGEGDVLRFIKTEDGMKMVVQTGKTNKDTTTVSLDAMTSADGAGTAGLISYLADLSEHTHDISAQEANTMLAAYNVSGGDVGRFIDDYTTAYLEGYAGIEASGTGLGKEIANVARTNGMREAEQDEQRRKERASAYKAVENPVAGWLGKVDNNSQVKGSGAAEALSGALEDMTESQRITAEASIEFGKAVGLNVVLFESNPENVDDIQNGSFDSSTHTVYLDINAGAGSNQSIQEQKNSGTLGYAMGRTLSHELTHYLEAAAPESYAKYSQAVKAALKAKGQDFAVLMRKKMDTAIQDGRKLTMQGAAAEVIADASEYMLQDSKFTSNLDTTVKGKIKAFIQNFAQKVKDIFRNLTGGHKESAALREMKDGVYHYMEGLQDLWDAGFVEILDKGTEDLSGNAIEMVEGQERKYSPRDYGLDSLNEDTVSNIKSRGQHIVTSREDLMHHVETALNGKDQETVFIGAIPDATKKSLEEETGVSIFRPLEYAYGISYDCIRHIRKHFSTSDEVADAIETVFSMIDDHDSVEVIKRKDGGINLMFKKGYDAIEVESVALTSNRTRTLTVKTAYISRANEKGAKINQAATFQSTGSSHLDPSPNDSVPQPEGKVNPERKYSSRDYADQTETPEFKRWFGESKVVDEDGNPLIVYHGTEANFNTFDMSKGRANMDIQGAFFSPYIEDAQGYGGDVKAVYLSIKNPADESTAYRALNKFKGQNGAGVKAREYLIRMGYDGVYNGYDEYIAFYPTQIKSATDNVGTFDPENPDIRYSTRDLPEGVTIRDYLRELKPTSRMNETEKYLLKKYQEQLKVLEEKEQLVAQQEEIIRTAPFRNEDGSLNDEITKAKNRYKIYRDQANRAARALTAYERDDGFAGILATGRQVVNELQRGSAGGIADAADALEKEVAELTAQLTSLEADVTRTASGQRTAFARGLYKPDDLKAAAQQLKDTYGSRMSVKSIADRLALTFGELYANDGAEGAKMFSAAAKDLAIDLLKGNKFRYKSEILPLLQEKIGSISLSETDVQEIENRGYTLREFRSVLSPYIKVTEGASDLSSYATNAQYYGEGALAAILNDDTEGNLAMRLYEVISQEKAKEAEIAYEGMTENQLIGMAVADIAGANLPMSANNQTVEYLRKELMKYAGENATVAIAVEEAIGKAKTTTAKAGNVWREAVKHTETARQAVEYYRKLEEQRRVLELAEQKKSLTEQLKSDNAQKLKEKVDKQKAEYRAREQKAREYRKSREELNKLRRRISRNVKTINALRVRETDQKHVPQDMQHVADLVMQTFTDTSLGRLAFSEQKLLGLGRRYRALRELATDATYFWDDEIEAEIENLQALGEAYSALKNKEGNVPSHLSVEGVAYEMEILNGVDHIVSNVLNLIDATNDNFLRKRSETFEQFANKTGEKLRAHADRKTLKGIPGKLQEMLDETLVKGNTTPVYFFEHLDNPEIMDVFNEIREGQSYYAKIVAEGKDFVQAAKAKYNYGSWVNNGKLKFETSQKDPKTGKGHMIELTREEAAEIYAIAKREKANKLYQTEHLLSGGFQYKHRDQHVSEDGKTLVKNESHQLDAADIAKIDSWLTAEQKAYADELVGFLSTTMADYGNEASMDMYGYKKFTESYYIPFHTVANQRFQKGDEGPQGENAGTGRVKNSGFTHKVQYKANQPLYVGGLTETVADHIHKMAAYSAMVQPIENMKRLLNHKVLENDGTSNTIRALIGQKYGKASEDYMTQLLKDLNGATQSDQRAATLTDKLVGAFKRGAVMASASVVLQQPTAAARAMAYISPKYFVQNPFYRPSKGTWDEMMKYSGTAVIKDMGKFDVGMGLTATQYISDENLSVMEAYQRLKGESKTKAGKAAYDRFMAWLTAAPGAADQWTWGLIWKANKAMQAELHPEMDHSSEAFLKLCGETFDDVIDHTQVYDSVLTRSNLMRSTNALHKMATSFMSEPTLSLNMLYDALTGIKSKRHTGWHRGRIIGSVVASQVLAGALAALVQAWNDDDDERNWLEKYADRATGNIIDNIFVPNMIPYVSDIVSLFQGYDVERMDTAVISDVITYSTKFIGKVADGKELTLKDWENFAGTWANLTGVPAKNIFREIRRTINAVTKTDWSAPDAFGVRQAMLENTWGYGSAKNDYYQRIMTALARGETELAEDYKTFMLASKAVDEAALTEGIRSAYKDAYKRGGIDKEQAIDFLLDNNLVTGDTEDKRKQSAFQYVDKWEEGTANYSAYNTLKEAYKAINFTEIQKAWKELTNNGYSDEQVKKQSRTLIKELVQDGTLTTGQATQLLRKWCPYEKDSDNTSKPQEWLKDTK